MHDSVEKYLKSKMLALKMSAGKNGYKLYQDKTIRKYRKISTSPSYDLEINQYDN